LNASGQALFTTAAFAIGAHNVKATYNGDTNFVTSTGTVRQTVTALETTTTLISSRNPSAVGQAVTFTAQVVSSTGAIPTGSVLFKDGGKTLATVTLSPSGQAVFTTTSLKKGTAKITAVYGGDTTFAASTSPTLNQAVQ